jgi:hypothetical protein
MNCIKCGKSPAKFKCSKCRKRYCSARCQKSDWKVHKKICKPIELSAGDGAHEISRSTEIESKETLNISRGLCSFYNEPLLPVTLDCSPSSRGRCLRAKRDIEVGELVLAAEAFSVVKQEFNMSSHCHWCLKKKSSSKPFICKHCERAIFCSEECYAAGLNHHAFECNALKKFVSNSSTLLDERELVSLIASMLENKIDVSDHEVPDDKETVRLLISTISAKRYLGSCDSSTECGVKTKMQFEDVMSLKSHLSQSKLSSKWPIILASGKKLLSKLRRAELIEPKDDMTADQLIGLLYRIRYNAFPCKFKLKYLSFSVVCMLLLYKFYFQMIFCGILYPSER